MYIRIWLQDHVKVVLQGRFCKHVVFTESYRHLSVQLGVRKLLSLSHLNTEGGLQAG